MTRGFLASARRWVAALGLAVAVTAPTMTGAAVAAPFVPLPQASTPAVEGAITRIRDRRDGPRYRRYEYRGDRGWDRGRNWRRDRDRYERRRHYRGRDRGRDFGNLALGLGVGVPLGALLARPYYDEFYGYYDDRYVVRRVAPRPVYRSYGGDRHVNWCHGRYRSYRAYDNSFQPYDGPRQQCYSPFG